MAFRLRLPAFAAAQFAGDDDRALLARFTEARESAAFAGLVGRHARMVYGVCRRAVRDEHLAEDAFQAVFLVLARNPARAANAASVGGWLFGIARRVGLAARRHARRAEVVPPGGSPGAYTPGSPSHDFDDLLRVLDDELAALPEAYRAPLVACFLEERTQDEAAKQLGWSLSTLRRRLNRGKELLRARLTRRGVTLAAGLFAGALAPSARAAVPRRALESVAPTVSPSPLAAKLATELVHGVGGMKLAFAVAVLALGIGGLALGFGGEPGNSGFTPAARPTVSPIPKDADVKPWGTVTGYVVYPGDGAVPKPKLVPPGGVKDAEFFGEPPVGDVLVNPKTRGLVNAVVWLRPDSDDRKAVFPAEKIHPTLAAAKAKDHRVECGKEGFTPRIVAARAGDRIVYANPSPIPFNVHYQRTQTAEPPPMGMETGDFNLLLAKEKEHTTKPLPSTRMCDLVKDNIHPWVKGYVWAFDHPYFAVTDADGKFTIPDAPAGNWRLVVWHEKVGYRNGAKGRTGETIAIVAGRKLELKPLAHESEGWSEE